MKSVPSWVRQTTPPDPIVNLSKASDDSIGITTHTYTLKQTRGADGKVYQVAAHSSVTDILGALIKGYHYHRKPRYQYGRSRKRQQTPTN